MSYQETREHLKENQGVKLCMNLDVVERIARHVPFRSSVLLSMTSKSVREKLLPLFEDTAPRGFEFVDHGIRIFDTKGLAMTIQNIEDNLLKMTLGAKIYAVLGQKGSITVWNKTGHRFIPETTLNKIVRELNGHIAKDSKIWFKVNADFEPRPDRIYITLTIEDCDDMNTMRAAHKYFTGDPDFLRFAGDNAGSEELHVKAHFTAHVF